MIDYPMNEYVMRGDQLFRKIGTQEVLVKCRWMTNNEDSRLMDQWGFTHQIQGCSSGAPIRYNDEGAQ
jgi:hypothetical protein